MPYRQRVPFTLATAAIPRICLRPTNTALLIQDMQRLFVDREYGLGKVAAERGILVEFEPYYTQLEKVVENIARLKTELKKAGMPVIYTRWAYDPKKDIAAAPLQRATGFDVSLQEEGSRIVERLQPDEEDIVVSKGGFGAFSDTELDQLLAQMNIDNLILTGVITEFGINLGYHPLVISDGTASMTYATQSRTLGEMAYGLTKVRSSGELLTYLEEMKEDDGKFI